MIHLLDSENLYQARFEQSAMPGTGREGKNTNTNYPQALLSRSLLFCCEEKTYT